MNHYLGLEHYSKSMKPLIIDPETFHHKVLATILFPRLTDKKLSCPSGTSKSLMLVALFTTLHVLQTTPSRARRQPGLPPKIIRIANLRQRAMSNSLFGTRLFPRLFCKGENMVALLSTNFGVVLVDILS